MVDVPAPQASTGVETDRTVRWSAWLAAKFHLLFGGRYECGCHVWTDQGYVLAMDEEERLKVDPDLPPPGREVWVRRGP